MYIYYSVGILTQINYEDCYNKCKKPIVFTAFNYTSYGPAIWSQNKTI